MSDIYSFLRDHKIEYEKCEHPPVRTCEDVARFVPSTVPGMQLKNLLVRNKQKTQYLLVVVPSSMNVDMKALGKELDGMHLSFSSSEDLKELLGVEPGAATILGLISDTQGKVKPVLDTRVWDAEAVQCHPMINTATLVLTHENVEKFMSATKHDFSVMDIPERTIE